MRLIRSTIAAAAVAAACMGAGPAAAQDNLTLVTPVNSVDTVISEVILREAYRRLGIAVTIRKYPAERALKTANQGRVDGEVQRINGLSKKYKNLIQVKPPINYINGTVFAKSADFIIQGWKSLAPYRIGIVRGIKFAERNTQGMKTYPATDYAHLVKMLDKDRVDVVVSPGVNGWFQIKQLNLKGIREMSPPVARFELFHYLHKKNASLVPRIAKVISEMEINGDLLAIREHVINVMLARAEQGHPLCDKDYACFELK